MKIEDFVHWLKKYEDLPLFRPKPVDVDDDDIAFQSDMAYFRDLLLEIQLQAMASRTATPFPYVLSDELDHALTEMAGIKHHIREMRRER